MTAGTRGFTAADFERNEHRKTWSKPRPKGVLPPLTDEILDDVEWLRDWLTVSLRPRQGWRVIDFEHGEDPDTPCTLIVANGTDRACYRFRTQRELNTSATRLRNAISTVASGQLRPKHVNTAELGDLFQALCALRPALAGEDELEQAKDWLFRLLEAAKVLEGHSMTDAATRRDALLALRRWREFTFLDALAIKRAPDDPWPHRPVCLLDSVTGEMWLRARESITFLRGILDLRMRQSLLTRRWEEIGVDYRYFEARARRPGDPHPKAYLYRVPRATEEPE